MRHLFIATALTAALGLSACGDEKKGQVQPSLRDTLAGKGDGSPFGEGGIRAEDLVDVLKNAGQIELTDAMMETYVDRMRELKEAGATATQAWMKSHGMDWRQWLAISTVIAGSKSHIAISDQLQSAEKRLADVRSKLEGAEEANRPTLEATVRGYEKQLEVLRKMPGATDLDRKNQALLKRWAERLEAARAR